MDPNTTFFSGGQTCKGAETYIFLGRRRTWTPMWITCPKTHRQPSISFSLFHSFDFSQKPPPTFHNIFSSSFIFLLCTDMHRRKGLYFPCLLAQWRTWPPMQITCPKTQNHRPSIPFNFFINSFFSPKARRAEAQRPMSSMSPCRVGDGASYTDHIEGIRCLLMVDFPDGK